MNPLVQPDPGLFIWTILTFLVLVALLARFAWRPLLQALERRQETIARSLEEAQRARHELERIQRESAQMMASARAEAESIVARSRSDAEALREELKQKARADAAGIVKNAENQIQMETARAPQQPQTLHEEDRAGRHQIADKTTRMRGEIVIRHGHRPADLQLLQYFQRQRPLDASRMIIIEPRALFC